MDIIKKLDGWMNVFTGLGMKNRDKGSATSAHWNKPIEIELEELYAADDVARTIVDEIPNEGTREWIEFVHDNPEIVSQFKDLMDNWKVREAFRQAWSWARLHGGSGIWLVTDADQMQVQEPLDIDQIANEGGLKSIVVFSRWELVADQINANPASSNYGLPETYSLSPRFGTGNTGLKLHHTRVLRFDGLPLPRRLMINNNYWSDSVLTSTVSSIRNFNNAHLYSVNALSDFSVPVIKLKNLASLFAAGQEATVQARLHSMNMCRSVLRIIALDEEEDFQFISRSLASVPETVEKAAERLVVASKMPRTKILGDSAKGINNGGEADERKWYDFVKNQQEMVLANAMDKLLKLIMLSPGSPTGGNIDPGLTWKFKSLWQSTDTQRADLYAKISTADATYLDRGVISPSQVAERFETENFALDLMIAGEEPLGMSNEEAEMQLNEIKKDAGMAKPPRKKE